MSELYFTVPPLPYYLMCGRVTSPVGDRHPRRNKLGVFDLLVVERGCLFVGEEDRTYELSTGRALLLRPDAYHYPVRPNREETIYYWLHFTTAGDWRWRGEDRRRLIEEETRTQMDGMRSIQVQPFEIAISSFTDIQRPERVFGLLEDLLKLEYIAERNGGSWRQQTLFQELLQQFSLEGEGAEPTPSRLCADRAAAYLREHYRDEVTAGELGTSLNFHPGYITRCMNKELGCSPGEYLLRYRLEQAKRLLLQTSLPIAHIAGEVGFNQAAYFTARFLKTEGLTPRDYRKRYWRG